LAQPVSRRSSSSALRKTTRLPSRSLNPAAQQSCQQSYRPALQGLARQPAPRHRVQQPRLAAVLPHRMQHLRPARRSPRKAASQHQGLQPCPTRGNSYNDVMSVIDSAALPLPLATFWRRFMAMVYEGIILFGVLFFFAYGFSALLRVQRPFEAKFFAMQIFLFLVVGCYFVYFWSRGRRSLPMKTVDLLLQNKAGGPVSVGRAWARYCAACGVILLGLALAKFVHASLFVLIPVLFCWPLIDRRKRALYDWVAGTELLVVPVAKKPQAFTQST
jgi:uncharacterized RDD family membrane protein YckC